MSRVSEGVSCQQTDDLFSGGEEEEEEEEVMCV